MNALLVRRGDIWWSAWICKVISEWLFLWLVVHFGYESRWLAFWKWIINIYVQYYIVASCCTSLSIECCYWDGETNIWHMLSHSEIIYPVENRLFWVFCFYSRPRWPLYSLSVLSVMSFFTKWITWIYDGKVISVHLPIWPRMFYSRNYCGITMKFLIVRYKVLTAVSDVTILSMGCDAM
jgi:hypothetical protein